MIYDPQFYNPVVKKLSSISLAQIWTTIGFCLLEILLLVVAFASGADALFAVAGVLGFFFLIAILVLFILYIIRLYGFKNILQGKDRSSVNLMITSIWINLACSLLSIIGTIITFSNSNGLYAYMYTGDITALFSGGGIAVSILASLGSIAAFVINLVGLAGLKNSKTIYIDTATGFGRIFWASIILIISIVVYFLFGILAVATGVSAIAAVGSLLVLGGAICALVLNISGWVKVGSQFPIYR